MKMILVWLVFMTGVAFAENAPDLKVIKYGITDKESKILDGDKVSETAMYGKEVKSFENMDIFIRTSKKCNFRRAPYYEAKRIFVIKSGAEVRVIATPVINTNQTKIIFIFSPLIPVPIHSGTLYNTYRFCLSL